MPRVFRSLDVPYPAPDMFSLVADIERYPRFLPWCRSATVHARTATVVTASLDIARGPFRKSFTTRNRMLDLGTDRHRAGRRTVFPARWALAVRRGGGTKLQGGIRDAVRDIEPDACADPDADVRGDREDDGGCVPRACPSGLRLPVTGRCGSSWPTRTPAARSSWAWKCAPAPRCSNASRAPDSFDWRRTCSTAKSASPCSAAAWSRRIRCRPATASKCCVLWSSIRRKRAACARAVRVAGGRLRIGVPGPPAR